MKFGFPWSVKDIRPEARETARDAARRSGMPLDEWLNSVILRQAAEQNANSRSTARGIDGASAQAYSQMHLRLDELSRRMDQITRAGAAAYAPKQGYEDADHVADLIARLEQRFDQLSGSRPATTQARPGLDRAIAEIAARRRELNGETAPVQSQSTQAFPPVPTPAPRPATAPAQIPAQDLSGLENELRRITYQIETLRRPEVEEAINALRAELGTIGRTLNDAMPRQAIEAIEKQIQVLSQRIAEGRQAGVNSGALAGIERGLAEVRDALHGLTPAENLVGYNEAINALAHKIDIIVAQSDPAMMMQLENSIATLREMATHVASNEAVSALAAQVKALAAKVDQLATADTSAAIKKLEGRIEEVSRTLSERTQTDVVPPRLEALVQSLSSKIEQMQKSPGDSTVLDRLENRIVKLEQPSRFEGLLQSLSEKIEQIQQSRGDAAALARLEDRIGKIADQPRLEGLLLPLAQKIEQIQQSHGNSAAFAHLEDRVVKLMERLEASNSRLAHLEAIERGVADLLIQIDDIRANSAPAALWAEETSTIDTLKHDVARTQNTVEAMHGTLGRVVDRLGSIEKEIQTERQRAVIPSFADLDFAPPPIKAETPTVAKTAIADVIHGPVAKTAIADVIHGPALAPQPPVAATRQSPAAVPAEMLASISAALAPPVSGPASAPPVKPLPAPTPAQINPDIMADQPLEPGSGPPRPSTHPGARIAASEAALGSARPNIATPGGKSDFIAAARRAAQAAGQEPRSRPSRSEMTRTGESPSLRTKVMSRVKMLFLAASIVAVVIGSFQFAGNIFDFGFFDKIEGKVSQVLAPASPTRDDSIAAAQPEPETSASIDVDGPENTGGPAAAPIPPLTKPNADFSATLLAPPTLPIMTPANPVGSGAAEANPPTRPNQAQGTPTSASAPASSAPLPTPRSAPKGDVTGTVTPVQTQGNRQQPSAIQPQADRLPASIGGARLRNAALNGDAAAAYEVATRFAEGRGVATSLEDAAHWYEIAAIKGLAPAQFRYASMLEKGQGVRKDLDSARKLYVAAAGKGHAKAMHNLAVLYAEGVDGKPDYASAAQWFRKAAEYGVADSQYNLGVLAARGIGTERNMAESYKWFALAAAQGDKDAGRKRDEVATQLDPQALAGAQQATKSFVAQSQPAEAIAVPAPGGGWDRTTPPSQEKPRAGAPLSISAYNSGKL